jgi:hypothetical protein
MRMTGGLAGGGGDVGKWANKDYARKDKAGSGLHTASRKLDTECGTMTIVSAAVKTLAKMRRIRTGWRIEELQSVAEEHLVEWRRPGRGGSHVIFSAPGVRGIVSVPSKRPIKPVYISQFLALVDAANEVKQSESQDEAKS